MELKLNVIELLNQGIKKQTGFDVSLEFMMEAIGEKLSRENPQPLTLEELKQMNGEPVYIVFSNDSSENMWGIVYYNKDYKNGQIVVGNAIEVVEAQENDIIKYYKHKPIPIIKTT